MRRTTLIVELSAGVVVRDARADQRRLFTLITCDASAGSAHKGAREGFALLYWASPPDSQPPARSKHWLGLARDQPLRRAP